MEIKVCVVGLGYVGLPLAIELSKYFKVSGFDIKEDRIKELTQGVDRTKDVDNNKIRNSRVTFTFNPNDIQQANFIIVCVPTPIDDAKKPDLTFVEKASKLVGKNLSPNSIVVYESTVYPGVTEDICIPILEQESGLKLGNGFKVGYSPERVNPGDKEHTIDKIIKVVSGSDSEGLDIIDKVYGSFTKTHRAGSIKVAEAAKVIENIQRDLNISLMNELAVIFDKMDIPISEVLNAAKTKWNFHNYKPGLVGGHCIGVDPYYLTHKAQELGHHPEVILAGRRINDNMHKFYSEKILKHLIQNGVKVKDARVLVLGLTFKPNVSDFRNSRVKELVHELKNYGLEVCAHDPWLNKEIIKNNFGAIPFGMGNLSGNFDLIISAVQHDYYNSEEFLLLLGKINSVAGIFSIESPPKPILNKNSY